MQIGVLRLGRAVVALARAIEPIVFPARCPACGEVAAGGALCTACAAAVAGPPGPRCGRCAAALGGGRPCDACAARALGVRRTVVVGPYEGRLRALVRGLKFGGRPALARPLGRLLAERVAAARLGAEVAVAVPVDPRRGRRRGYDQAALLGREVAARAGIPFAEGVLARSRHTPALFRRGAAERFEAVAGAFGVADPAAIRGRRVLIVDDILTTGATLAACAAACREAGAAEVEAACVARRERRVLSRCPASLAG